MKNHIGEAIKCEDNVELDKHHLAELAKVRETIIESDNLENDSEELEDPSG